MTLFEKIILIPLFDSSNVFSSLDCGNVELM
jgi:hypothetical protein